MVYPKSQLADIDSQYFILNYHMQGRITKYSGGGENNWKNVAPQIHPILHPVRPIFLGWRLWDSPIRHLWSHATHGYLKKIPWTICTQMPYYNLHIFHILQYRPGLQDIPSSLEPVCHSHQMYSLYTFKI